MANGALLADIVLDLCQNLLRVQLHQENCSKKREEHGTGHSGPKKTIIMLRIL